MILERLFHVVFRALDAVDAVRERLDSTVSWLKGSESSKDFQSNVGGRSDQTENTWRSSPSNINTVKSKPKVSKTASKKRTTPSVRKVKKTTNRASSTPKAEPKTKLSQPAVVARSGKQISSPRANRILKTIQEQKIPVVRRNSVLLGKRSLASVVWALSAAEKSEIKEGVSVHDISALLFKAAGIEIYPINVSRMLHDNGDLIKQVTQEKRTKRYLLTDKGHEMTDKLQFKT